MKRILATASIAALLATGANALTVDLTFGGGGDVTNLGTYSTSGVFDDGMLTGSIDTWTPVLATKLTQAYNGLGVKNLLDTNQQLDGHPDESITFNFDFAVDLISVTFADFDTIYYNDNADIHVDGTQVGFNSTDTSFFFGTSGLGATSFAVGADEHDVSFRILSFEYEMIAAVPVPAAGFLLFGALAGLGGLSRRKKPA